MINHQKNMTCVEFFYYNNVKGARFITVNFISKSSAEGLKNVKNVLKLEKITLLID